MLLIDLQKYKHINNLIDKKTMIFYKFFLRVCPNIIIGGERAQFKVLRNRFYLFIAFVLWI